ncbi:MAG TPA: hypothetical protein VMY37_22785 [Thermoguttaceae bacterium]|nr:hypothetical protein [Thermoguttaceae bacterium]
MRSRLAWLPMAFLGLAAGVALSQQPTTVQLPTYSYFTTSTTVSVPDRGSVYLGGVKRAATGRNEFGTPLLPFRNRSIGTERSASGVSVSVYIHDFEAMDEYLLSQPIARGSQPAVTRRLGPPIAGSQPRPALPASTGDVWPARLDAATQGSAGPMAKSLAELRAEHEREQQARQGEAAKWLQRGRQAESAGKANVARVYYQMAARRATGPLKDQVAARLDTVDDGSPKPPKFAQSQPRVP